MRCEKRKQKRDKYQQHLNALPKNEDTFFEHRKPVKPLRALTKNQYDLNPASQRLLAPVFI